MRFASTLVVLPYLSMPFALSPNLMLAAGKGSAMPESGQDLLCLNPTQECAMPMISGTAAKLLEEHLLGMQAFSAMLEHCRPLQPNPAQDAL